MPAGPGRWGTIGLIGELGPAIGGIGIAMRQRKEAAYKKAREAALFKAAGSEREAKELARQHEKSTGISPYIARFSHPDFPDIQIAKVQPYHKWRLDTGEEITVFGQVPTEEARGYIREAYEKIPKERRAAEFVTFPKPAAKKTTTGGRPTVFGQERELAIAMATALDKVPSAHTKENKYAEALSKAINFAKRYVKPSEISDTVGVLSWIANVEKEGPGKGVNLDMEANVKGYSKLTLIFQADKLAASSDPEIKKLADNMRKTTDYHEFRRLSPKAQRDVRLAYKALDSMLRSSNAIIMINSAGKVKGVPKDRYEEFVNDGFWAVIPDQAPKTAEKERPWYSRAGEAVLSWFDE